MFAFLFKIWALARPYRFRLWLGVIMGVIAGFIEPLMIATVALVYEIIFSPPDSTIDEKLAKLPDQFKFVQDWVVSARDTIHHGIQAHPTAILGLVAIIPGMMFLRGLFSYLNIYLLQWAAIRGITDLRIRLFDHMMNLPAGFFNQSKTGDLIARILNDTLLLQTVISDATTTIVKDPSKLVALLIFLFISAPDLTLVSMVVMPLCLIPILVYGRKTRKTAGNMQSLYAELTNVMAESFSSNRIIKAYNLEGTVVDQFRTAARKLVGQTMRIVRSMETPGPLIETFAALGVAFIFLYLAWRGGGVESSAKFLKVVGSIFLMYQPLKNLGRLHNNLQQAQAASARVDELLVVPNTVPEPANPKPLKAAGADIEFKDVEFSFGEKVVLRRIDLTVKAGQFVALVGKTGSGKTTITNLLLRFYDPQSGSVRIGGTDIREVSTRELRNQIAVVTQETVLFNQTIRKNIEFGRPGATDADIDAAAKHAHATEFILERPDGFETIVGERGVTLSGGQRQRLAIARAMVRNAPILVLDEATSALDTESERIVQAALEDLMLGRTTVCIAHRLSTIQKADVIVVMEDGRIVETGRHEELLQRGGIYKKLYDLQFNG